jgi:cytochrome oxidase assembly protein ShyY1
VSTELPAPTRPPLTRRDLRSARWLAAHVGIVLLAVVFVFLGRWQWHAGHKVSPLTTQELTAWRTPQPVDSVITPANGLNGIQEGQAVSATGTYDASRQLLVPGRPLNGRPGFYLIAPLVTGPGQGVVINRGWLPAVGSSRPAIPAPPSGRVTVTGWAAEPESSTGAVNANGIVEVVPSEEASGSGEIALISPAQLVNLWPYHLLDGYISAGYPGSGAGGLVAVPGLLPVHGTSWDALNIGYAFQWCLFAVITLGWYALYWRRELDASSEAAELEEQGELEDQVQEPTGESTGRLGLD